MKKSFTIVILFLLIAKNIFAQWTQLTSQYVNDFKSVKHKTNGEIWIPRVDGILMSLDSGATFNFIQGLIPSLGNVPLPGSISDMVFTSTGSTLATGVFNLGNDIMILRNTSGAQSWSIPYTSNIGALPRYLNLIDISNTGVIVAAGTVGRICYSTNNGVTWIPSTANTTKAFMDVAWVNGSNWVAITIDEVFGSSNDGQTWTSLGTYNYSFQKISFVKGTSTGYLLTSNLLFKTTDGGVTWAPLSTNPPLMTSLFAVSADTLYVGTTNGIYKSTDSGTYWKRYQNTPSRRIDDINFVNSNYGIAVGLSGYIIKTTNGGSANMKPYAPFSVNGGSYCQYDTITVTNQGDPTWQYKWYIDGILADSVFAPSLFISNSGQVTIKSVATYNGLSDSTTVTISVSAFLQVDPFAVLHDSVCTYPGHFFIPNSQSGVNYTLYNHLGVPISSQWGNGSTITFTTQSNSTWKKKHTITGVRNGICGTDSLSVIDSVYTPSFNPQSVAYVLKDTICIGDLLEVVITHTKIGYEYFVYFSGTYVKEFGNGDSIILKYRILSSGNFSVQAGATDTSMNCSSPISYNALPFVSIYTNYTITPSIFSGYPGQPINISLNTLTYTGIQWDYGSNAIPPNSSGLSPTPPVYNTPGIDTIILTLSNTYCTHLVSIPVYISNPLPNVQVDSCGEFFCNYPMNNITKTYLDKRNNFQITFFEDASSSILFRPGIACFDSIGTIMNGRYIGIMSGEQGLPTAIAGDRLGNLYGSVKVNAFYNFRIGTTYVRSPNSLFKLTPSGKVQWVFESNIAEFLDLIETEDRIFAIGMKAWNGFSINTPKGVFNFSPTISTKGEAFILEVSPEGEILDFNAFGGAGIGGVNKAPTFGYLTLVNNGVGDVDTLRTNFIARESKSGGLIISGLIGLTDTLPNFQNVQMTRNLALGTTNFGSLFSAKYDLQLGFTQAVAFLSGVSRLNDLQEDQNGNYVITGIVRGSFTTSASNVILPKPYTDYSFIGSFKQNGDVNWIIYNDSLNFVSSSINSDGTYTACMTLTNYRLFIDALNTPYLLSSIASPGTYLIKLSPNGALLAANKINNQMAVSMKADACGTYHTFYSVSNGKGLRSINSYNGSCSNSCFFQQNPGYIDAGLDAITLNDYTTSGNPNRDIIIRLKNNSPIQLNSIEFRVIVNNDTLTNITWAGILNPGDTISYVISNYNLNRTYNRIKASIINVNGTNDFEPLNNNYTLNQTICSQPLQGTYSVGCDTCYFNTIQSSSTTASTCGVSGPTRFEILPGDYAEQISIRYIPNASITDSVVWTSATNNTDVKIEFAPGTLFARHVVSFDSASFCSFTNVTFKNLDICPVGLNWISTYEKLIIDIKNSDNILISNNNFISARNTGRASMINLDDGNSNISIIENEFSGGLLGLFSTNSSISRLQNLTVKNNLFSENIVPLDLMFINNLVFENNRIEANMNTISSIEMDSINNFICLKNNIIGFGNFSITGHGTISNPSRIENNLFGLWSVPKTFNMQGSYIDFIHNTIGGGIKIYSPSSNIRMVNNLLRSTTSPILEYSGSPSTLIQCDYNGYHSLIGPLTFKGPLGSYNLQQWRSFTGFDINSDSVETSFASYNDLHLADTLNKSGIPWPGITDDLDGDQRNATNPVVGADEVPGNYTFIDVWPGDCDSSMQVDVYDILPVGLNYLKSYTPSQLLHNITGVGLPWEAYPALPWPETQGNGANLKHADADGNGIINSNDLLYVDFNYSLIHSIPDPFANRLNATSDISIISDKPVYIPGDTVKLAVVVGSSANPLFKIGGAGFEISIPSTLVKNGSLSFNVDKTWICPDNSCLFSQKIDLGGIVFSGAVVRTDGDGPSNFGPIGRIQFVIDSSYNGSSNVNIPFVSNRAYDPNETPIVLNQISCNIQVSLPVSLSEPTDFPVRIYPNPVSNNLYINFTNEATEQNAIIQIFDLAGRLEFKIEKTLSEGGQTMEINTMDLESGPYIIQFILNGKNHIGKFIKAE